MDDRIYLHDEASRAVDRTIYITGMARSGTTLMGTLVQSFQNVEYAYEPPMICALVPLIDSLAEWQFKFMFETYIYEDLLMNQIAGRYLNLNPADDSYFLKAKSEKELKARHAKSWRKFMMHEQAEKVRPALKMPDAAPYLKKITQYYPEMTVVAMHRRANPVINSVLNKKWLTNERLKSRHDLWPSRNKNGSGIPLWVETEYMQEWGTWSEVDRAGYYYLRMVEPLLDLKHIHVISYDRLLENSRKGIESLAEKLHVMPGEKTAGLISDIYERTTAEEDWVKKLSPVMQKKVIQASDIFLTEAITGCE